MSEYWVSHKKYFCKYCDIYITDDAPSRRQHEAGLRHKGNRERFVRNLYKQGERRKKDLADEKREMTRVEAAASAAFARDVSSGHASMSSSTSQTSRPETTSKKPERPASVWSNYMTAQSLGITDPDEERMRAETERRRTQGTVGEWEVVAPPPPPLPDEIVTPKEEDSKTALQIDALPHKREAGAPPEDGGTRHFKLHKRTIGVGLGEIWDPGDIPIKLKPKWKGEAMADPTPGQATTKDETAPTAIDTSKTRQPSPASTAEKPESQNADAEKLKWQPVQWKRATDHRDVMQANSNEENAEQKKFDDADPSITEDEIIKPRPDSSGSKQLMNSVHPKIEPSDEEVPLAKVDVKSEETSTSTMPEPTGGLFRKRKVPAASRGRRG